MKKKWAKTEIKKEIKNFLELTENEDNILKPIGHNECSSKGKYDIIKCLHKNIDNAHINNTL